MTILVTSLGDDKMKVTRSTFTMFVDDTFGLILVECVEINIDGDQAALIPTDMFNEEMTERIVNVVEDALKKEFENA